MMLSDAAIEALPQPFVDENVQRQLRWQARHAKRPLTEQYGFDRHDPLLGWRLRPNAAVRSVKARAYDVMVHSNPQGLRGAEPVSVAKPAGRMRIGIFGCSLTFGEGVQDDETYSAQLATLLPGTEVLNFGVHGYGTDQMLLRYETEGRQYQLDMLIIAFAWFHMPRNLHHFHFFAKPTYELLPTGQLQLQRRTIPTPVEFAHQSPDAATWWPADQSVLLRWLWQRIRRLQDRQLYRADSRGWQLTRALLQRFVRQAQAAGTTVVLLSIDERQPQLDGQLATFAQELDIGFVDLGPMLRAFNTSGYAYRLVGDGHWNAAGTAQWSKPYGTTCAALTPPRRVVIQPRPCNCVDTLWHRRDVKGRSMRILYTHYKPPQRRPGGMDVHIAYSTEAIRSLGHEIEVLPMWADHGRASASQGAPRQRSALRKQIARFVYEPRCFYRYPRHLRKLWRAIRSFHPDVILARYMALEFSEFLLAKWFRIPIVYEVNATSFQIEQWYASDIYLYPLTRQLENAVLGASNGMLVITQSLKSMLSEFGLPAALMTVNPNGADPDRFHPDTPSEEARQQLGLGDAFVVGFMGSFHKWHDVGTIFRVMPDLLRANPQVKFFFAGGDQQDLGDDLRAQLTSFEDRVVFTGPLPLDRAPEYLAAMDIALSLVPDIRPFNNSLVKLFEYLAAGKAIICTAIGQQAELIEDGVNGLLVAPGDAAGLKTRVQRLIEQPELRRELGRQARATLLANYTWTHNARRILDVCETALNRLPPRPKWGAAGAMR